MTDEEKTKEELITELKDLRKKLERLKKDEVLYDNIRERLSRSVDTFRSLFDQASDSIFLLEFGEAEGPVIADINVAACEMHGYEKNELIGKPIRILDSSDTGKHVDERAQKLLQGDKITFEGEHIRKDGTVFPVEVSAQRVAIGGKAYILAIDRDITERKKAEEIIKKERDRAQLFFDFAGVMLVVINTDQTVNMINRRGCEILGFTREEIIGKNWFDAVIPEGIREDVRRTFEMLIAGEIEQVEYFENPVRTKNGEEIIIAWHNTILRDEKGNIIATLSSGEDIAERKKRRIKV